MNKDIVEMAKHIASQYCKTDGCWDCEYWDDDLENNPCCEIGDYIKVAKNLYNNGYANVEQAIRKFAEELIMDAKFKEVLTKKREFNVYRDVISKEQVDEQVERFLKERNQ